MTARWFPIALLAAAGPVAALLCPPQAFAEDYVGFTSPSGNIGCMLVSTDVRCDIADRTWSPPPRPADCPGFTDYGQGIGLAPGGAPSFVCAGDTVLGQGKPLQYGQSIRAGALQCDSAESGVTCHDVNTGRGFSLSRDGYVLF